MYYQRQRIRPRNLDHFKVSTSTASPPAISEDNQTTLKKSTTIICMKRLRRLYLARSIDYVGIFLEVARTLLYIHSNIAIAIGEYCLLKDDLSKIPMTLYCSISSSTGAELY
jgi:hypothetical protein